MEITKIDFIPEGTVTSPKGFLAGAVRAGIKKTTSDKLDLGILFSEKPCAAAGMFTRSRIKSAPVMLDYEKLKSGRVVAVVANSGCANAYTGKQGMADAVEMAEMTAGKLKADPVEVLVCSTGVTGQLLPMDLIKENIKKITVSRGGGHDLARAIMTTDTVPKEAAVSVSDGESKYTIGGIAKGSGMIHPNMATMFGFLTTDAALEPDFLKSALKRAVDNSFNMISVDQDTSPSDTVLLMANGLAGGKKIGKGSRRAGIFQRALDMVCVHLARALARDGEGANRLITATVGGASGKKDARKAAKSIIGSTLVKTAVYGGDPNWGRIIMALGHAEIDVELEKIDMSIGEVGVLKAGKPLLFEEDAVIRVLKQNEVPISVNLNLGSASATAWGCDLSEEYVLINSEYMT
jgi:glutamate N-acetyltransferase/amino-acid N-acetyltransferase